uniref:Uncharacterized protein n=1 Tax=Caudovirales sp. ctCpR1 TaxID=2825760 RepID=A0A8S5V900_9CAUD|nr:MAG TPA: hypothetical protein [Caudovirales sp. ctCpR1]
MGNNITRPRQRSQQRAPIATQWQPPRRGDGISPTGAGAPPHKTDCTRRRSFRPGSPRSYPAPRAQKVKPASPAREGTPQHNAAGHKTNGSPHNGNSAPRASCTTARRHNPKNRR